MQLSASSLDLSDAILISYFMGALSTFLISGAINSLLSERKQKYQKLIRQVENLINYKELLNRK
ncbi:MAG: hypothetical protein QNJ32_02320 [Xenococcaceae cyanobacterium MO_167.B27]|nr:hypothetical protein [Xenococcaceae cyanobacterium MO_167.B27]